MGQDSPAPATASGLDHLTCAPTRSVAPRVAAGACLERRVTSEQYALHARPGDKSRAGESSRVAPANSPTRVARSSFSLANAKHTVKHRAAKHRIEARRRLVQARCSRAEGQVPPL